MKKILLLLLVSLAAMVSFASAQYGSQDSSYSSSDSSYGSSGSYSSDMCKENTKEKCRPLEFCDKCNEKHFFDGLCDKCNEKCLAFEFCPKCHKTYASDNPDGRCDFCGSDTYGWETCDKCKEMHNFDGNCDKCGEKCDFNRECEKCVTVCCESEQPMVFQKIEKECVAVCEEKKVEEKKPKEVELEIKKPVEKKVEEKKPMEKKFEERKHKDMMPYGSNYGGYMMGGQMGYSMY